MSNNWKPISLSQISSDIAEEVLHMDDNELRLWKVISVPLEKWDGGEYGQLGGGFWVAATIGNSVFWYNDIEDGWNASTWNRYGKLNELYCNQSNLRDSLYDLKMFLIGNSIK